MDTFLVSYDLRKPGRNYDNLYKALQKYPGYARPLESVWLLKSNDTSSKIRDDLGAHIDGNDGLLVVKLVDKGWSTKGIDKAQTDWMQKNY